MEIIKVEGIVISETNYSESSKILKIFTKDLGIISVMSKGSRNLKSKLRGISNKLSYANFYIYYKKDGISTLKDGDVIDTLRNIVFDIENISYVSYIIDLVSQVYKHSNSNEIYDLLISVIRKINDGFNPGILTNILELKLLKYLGISPNIESCSCGNKKDIVTISIKDGGLVCKNCYNGGKIYNIEVVKLIRAFMLIDINSIKKIDVKESVLKELSLFIDEYYDSLSGIYLKSKDFLKNINRI